MILCRNFPSQEWSFAGTILCRKYPSQELSFKEICLTENSLFRRFVLVTKPNNSPCIKTRWSSLHWIYPFAYSQDATIEPARSGAETSGTTLTAAILELLQHLLRDSHLHQVLVVLKVFCALGSRLCNHRGLHDLDRPGFCPAFDSFLIESWVAFFFFGFSGSSVEGVSLTKANSRSKSLALSTAFPSGTPATVVGTVALATDTTASSWHTGGVGPASPLPATVQPHANTVVRLSTLRPESLTALRKSAIHRKCLCARRHQARHSFDFECQTS